MQSEMPTHNYSRPAYKSPNYHPHASVSYAYRNPGLGETRIGGDVEPREKLRKFKTDTGFTYSMGASRDGVGVNRLENYKHDLETENGTRIFSRNGFYPFRVKPKIWLDRRFHSYLSRDDPNAMAILKIVSDAMRVLNDALPPEFQLEFAGSNDNSTEGSILFQYLSPEEINRQCSGGVACSSADISFLGYTRWADVLIPDNLDTSKYQTARTIILHELLHALGIRGHVDSIEFPDSLMGAYGDFFPNPGYVLHRIDREVLQIMYMSQKTDDYNDWGEWSDTSLHLAAESDDGHVHFGVALFNGLPQPWARGTTPESLLSRDKKPFYLFGSVTWKGALLGFSGVSPVIGDTELEVNMNNLRDDQDLRFRDLTFANRHEETGNERWFPVRNINYKVKLIENGFIHQSSAGKDGHVIGVFLGPKHEGMAGTLKRTDLVGAFGGTR